jgi:hypothetical protein
VGAVTEATRARTSTELRWVLRPSQDELLEHAGKEVYAVGVSKLAGHVEVTLADGSRVLARRDEVVAV